MLSQNRQNRRSSNVGLSEQQRTDTHERYRPGQVNTGGYVGVEARRGSVQTQQPDRARYTTRANSAPYVQSANRGSQESGRSPRIGSTGRTPVTSPTRAAFPSTLDSRVVAETDGINPPSPSQTPVDVNIVVLGNEQVGKSAFIQRSLDLSAPASAAIPSQTIAIAGSLFNVRMYETTIDDVYINEDDALSWPEALQGVQVDAVMTLYDVCRKTSFQHVPEILNAMNKTTLHTVLVACKCDMPPSLWQVDPNAMESRAVSAFAKVSCLQLSQGKNELYRRGVANLLQVINGDLPGSPDLAGGQRRRTMPSIAGPRSPQIGVDPGHARARSDQVPPANPPATNPEAFRNRHDSSQQYSSIDSKTGILPRKTVDNPSQSFLLDESQTEDSSETSTASTRTSEDSDFDSVDEEGAKAEPAGEEKGWSFDGLVDRLLALPTSKADSKFVEVFLALYRKFASPGQLLEAIVYRFEALDTHASARMSQVVSKLRHLGILEQWIRTYPGDFAYPSTFRRVRTFVAKVATIKILAAAALEMSAGLEVVTEDDDTNWAFCDKDRQNKSQPDIFTTWSHRISALLDDPSFDFSDELGGMSLEEATKKHRATHSSSSSSKYSMLVIVESARQQAQSLGPVPRATMSKTQWRLMMSFPDELIARELTRIDSIMFASMRPRDLVRHVSLSPQQKAGCRSLINVSRMIDHFNHIRDWVANYVLFRDKPKHRALMLTKMMGVARKVRELNNYNSLGAILAGVHSSAVNRLAATKELIPPDVSKDWMKLEILMSQSRSFATYRLAWENSNNQRIPYLPLPIRDLVAAESGNKTFLGDEVAGRINWRKFEIMGDVLVSIQRAQGTPYRQATLGNRNDEIRSLILNCKLVRNDESLYQRSTQVEASTAQAGEKPDRKGFREFFKR